MFTKKQVGLVAAAVASMALSAGVFAEATTNLTVSASIASECAIASAPSLDFGVYSPIVANKSDAKDASGNLSVTCTIGSTSPVITLGQGLYDTTGSAAAPARNMNGGAGTDKLAYALFSDTDRLVVWGNTAGTGKAVTTPDGTAHTETVYGRIAANQNKPVGSYSDTVLVTVTF